MQGDPGADATEGGERRSPKELGQSREQNHLLSVNEIDFRFRLRPGEVRKIPTLALPLFLLLEKEMC